MWFDFMKLTQYGLAFYLFTTHTPNLYYFQISVLFQFKLFTAISGFVYCGFFLSKKRLWFWIVASCTSHWDTQITSIFGVIKHLYYLHFFIFSKLLSRWYPVCNYSGSHRTFFSKLLSVFKFLNDFFFFKLFIHSNNSVSVGKYPQIYFFSKRKCQ